MIIPEEKIEEIRAVTDIVDVVGDYVQLKRRGSNFVGLCPFHNEKTPSFNVNPSMGIYKCFGCGAGGDVYQFVTQVEGVSFPEAARMLAERAGVVLPEQDDTREQANEVEELYHALRFAARFFYRTLTQEAAGKPALAYLQERGFTAGTIKHFGLGYAPDAWDALLRAATAHHIPAETLERAGLVIPRKDGSGHYDRYRGRIIFPIFSHVGKVLGFGGRILDAAADQPKYINSPETRVYNKSRVLYGLYQGKQAIRRREEVILVEGYTDVMALHQAGVEHVVASSGTALTEEQVKMLGRYARRVVLLYDADAAGAGAALRGIDLVLARGLSVYAVALPAGEDPDSFVRSEGREAFEAYMERHRKDFVTFIFEQARRAGRLHTPEGEADTQRAVLTSVARIPDPLMRESYLRRASEVLRVPDMQLRRVLQGLGRPRRREAPARPAPAPPPDAPPPPVPDPEPLPQENILLRLMLEHGRSLVEFILSHMAEAEFSPGPPRELVRCLLQMYRDNAVRPERILDGSHGEALQCLAAGVMMTVHEPSENWERRQNIPVPRLNEDPYESAASAMAILKRIRIDAAIAQVKAELYRAQQQGGDVQGLLARMNQLHALRKQIEARAFLSGDED